MTDRGLERLLDLDGETFQLDRGYWTKFDVRRVKPSVEVPHGIRYSLTLHDQHGKRLFGFDNAHAIPKARKYGARRVEWDHKHAEERVTAYFYTNSGRLLQDFWDEVSKLLEA